MTISHKWDTDFSEGIVEGLTHTGASVINDAHHLLQEYRQKSGLEPWDFSKPRVKKKKQGPHGRFTEAGMAKMVEGGRAYRVRMKQSEDIPGLRGDLIRKRLELQLPQTIVSRQLGLCQSHYSWIESGQKEITAEIAVRIRKWIDEHHPKIK